MQQNIRFADWLRDLLDLRRLKPADLARQMETQNSTVSRWLDGSIPHKHTLSRLERVLNARWDAEGPAETPSVIPALLDDLIPRVSEDTLISLGRDFARDAKAGKPHALDCVVAILEELQRRLTSAKPAA